MTVSTITISTTDFSSLVSVAEADAYLLASLELSAVWSAASTTTKSSAVVTATRMLDRIKWVGSKTSAAQPLSWPRSGVVDEEGEDVADDEVPQAVEDACCLLAGRLVASPGLSSGVSGSVSQVTTGNVSVTFGRAQETTAESGLPFDVEFLLRQFMVGYDSSGTAADGYVSGNTVDSQFEDERYVLEEPLK